MNANLLHLLSAIKNRHMLNFGKNMNASSFAEYDVVSFDLFDTLVRRHIHDPELVKVPVAKYIAHLLSREYGITVSYRQVLKRRYDLEAGLRENSVKKGYDYECKYHDIIKAILSSFLHDPQKIARHASDIAKYEISLEKRLLELMPGALDLIKGLKGSGKYIILTSEMYLIKDQICDILDHLDIASFIDDVFLSSETLFNKGSGRLFKCITKTREYENKKIVHIGDRLLSDYVMPRKLGLDAYYYFDYKEHLRKKRISGLFNRGKGNSDPKHTVSLASMRSNEGGCHYEIGLKLFGPLYFSFVLGVMEQLETLGMDHVFFVARDGYIPMRVYDCIRRNVFKFRDLPPPKYLHLSRKSTNLPSVVDSFGPREIERGLAKHHANGILSILETYGIDVNCFDGLFSQVLDTFDEQRVLNIFQSNAFKSVVEPQIRFERENLYSYLRQNDFFGRQRVALIDIGWSGSIVDNLDRAFGRLPEYPHIYAFFLGLIKRPGSISARNTFSEKAGILFDYRHANSREYYILEFYDFIEEVAKKHEGTTLGYKQGGNGGCIPILEDYELSDQEVTLKEIRKGCIDYARTCIDFNMQWDHDFKSIREKYNRYLLKKIYFPRISEVRSLENIYHDEDMGSTFRYSPVNKLHIKDFINFQNLQRKIQTSTWKPGTLSRLPFANYYYYLSKQGKKLTSLGGA